MERSETSKKNQFSPGLKQNANLKAIQPWTCSHVPLQKATQEKLIRKSNGRHEKKATDTNRGAVLLVGASAAQTSWLEVYWFFQMLTLGPLWRDVLL